MFFLECLGRTLDLVARLFKLLSFFGHAFLVFGRLHARLQLVGVAQYLLLLVLKPFELLPNLLFAFGGLSLLQRRLQILQPLVEVILPPS